MAATQSHSGRFLHPGLAFAAGVAALLGLMVLPRLVPHREPMVGKPAPELSLAVAANGVAGTTMSLADLKGKPVLLDFWASWCGPCAMEAPIVDRVARRYGNKGLVVMGVNVDDSPDVVRAYAEKKGLSYPMVLDVGRRASMLYGVSKLPSLILIDKQGNVHSFMTGLVDEASLNEAVGAAL